MQGQASDITIKVREVAGSRRTMCELIMNPCLKRVGMVMEDCQRVKYLQPYDVVEYGLINRMLMSEVSLLAKPSCIAHLN